MSEGFPSFSAPDNAGGHNAEGVRTYRGRTIEELIPQIRAELGPDAIILREREGLTGGIGGFFAQRCVEIDAQAAPRLSIYDEDYDDVDAVEDDGDHGDDDEAHDVADGAVIPPPVAPGTETQTGTGTEAGVTPEAADPVALPTEPAENP